MSARKLSLLICLFTSLLPGLIFASACNSTVNSIHSDIIEHLHDIQTADLPWMSLSWLDQHLGQGTTKTTGENQTRYYWNCPDNSGAHISVLADKTGKLISVIGQYSSDEGSGIFSARLNPSSAHLIPVHPLPQIVTTVNTTSITTHPEQQIQPQQTVALHPQPEITVDPLVQYNEHFKTSIQNRDQLLSDMTQKLAHYYTGLNKCKTGIYRFSIPMANTLVFPKASILGKQNENCTVELTYEAPNAEKVLLECQFQPQTLAFFTDAQAQNDIQDKASAPNAPTDLQKIMNSECQRYLNGKLTNNT